MEKSNNLKFNMIAAILFIVLAFIQLISFVMTFNIFGFLRLAAFIVLSAALFINKRDTVVNALIFTGLGILSLLMVFSLFYNLDANAYSVSRSSYSYTFGLTYKNHFNPFCILPALMEIIAYLGMVAVAFCMLTNYAPKFKKTAKTIWFVPAILVMASFILLFLLTFVIEVLTSSTWTYGHAICNFTNFVSHVLLTAAFLFTAGWITDFSISEKKQFVLPEIGADVSQDPAGQPGQAPAYAAPANTGFINILHHVLLLIFTFGIWYLVWIYKTTGYLNRVQDEPPRDPITKLLLCMFIPFYSIYWTYKSAQRVDKLARNQGIASDLTTLCVIFAIFIGIIPPIILQDKINSIALNTQPDSVPPSGPQGYNPQQGNTYNADRQAYSQADNQRDSNQQTYASQHTDADSVAEELKKYKEMLDTGLISQDDFDKKKQQLLGL